MKKQPHSHHLPCKIRKEIAYPKDEVIIIDIKNKREWISNPFPF